MVSVGIALKVIVFEHIALVVRLDILHVQYELAALRALDRSELSRNLHAHTIGARGGTPEWIDRLSRSITQGILLGMTDYSLKVAENRLRRLAARRGYQIRKSKARDAQALTYGLWQVSYDFGDEFDPILTRDRFHGEHWWLPLHQLEDWLSEEGNAAHVLKKRLKKSGALDVAYYGYKNRKQGGSE